MHCGGADLVAALIGDGDRRIGGATAVARGDEARDAGPLRPGHRFSGRRQPVTRRLRRARRFHPVDQLRGCPHPGVGGDGGEFGADGLGHHGLAGSAGEQRRDGAEHTADQRERERRGEAVGERITDQVREELQPGEVIDAGLRHSLQSLPGDLTDRVVAEEGGEQDADGRDVGDAVSGGHRHTVLGEPAEHGIRQVCAQPRDHQREEQADGEDHRGVLEGGHHAGTRPTGGDRQRVHHLGTVRRREEPHADSVDQQDDGEHPVVEVHRQCDESGEGARGDQHAGGGEPLGAQLVAQCTRDRCAEQEADCHGHHVDTGPQWGARVVVAVLRQPDALQPDDQDELQATTSDGPHQVGDVAEGERAVLEQGQLEQRARDLGLDVDEEREHDDAADEGGQHPRVGPAHVGTAVGLDAVGDADEDRDQADREGQVAPPVHLGVPALAEVMQFQVRPDGADDTERHRHQEDEVPLDGCEDTADEQTEERPGDGGHTVDAHGQAALVGRECVGEDGR